MLFVFFNVKKEENNFLKKLFKNNLTKVARFQIVNDVTLIARETYHFQI